MNDINTAIDVYITMLRCTVQCGSLYVVLLPYQCRGMLPDVCICQLCITTRYGEDAYKTAEGRATYKSPTGRIHEHTQHTWVYL